MSDADHVTVCTRHLSWLQIPSAAPSRLTRSRGKKPGVEPRLRTRADAFGHKWLGHNIGHPAACAASLFFPSEGLKPRRFPTETPCHIIDMSSRCNMLEENRSRLRSTLSASAMVEIGASDTLKVDARGPTGRLIASAAAAAVPASAACESNPGRSGPICAIPLEVAGKR